MAHEKPWAPWGVEQTREMLWVGPMRVDGAKVDDVVVGLSYDADLTHAAKVRQQQRAALIAAAPDLYAAAEVALITLAPGQNDDFVWAAMTQLKAALAKANGETAA